MLMMLVKLFVPVLIIGLTGVLINANPSKKNKAKAHEDKIIRGPDLPTPTFEQEVESTSLDEYLKAAAKRRQKDVFLIDAETKEEIKMKEFLDKSQDLATQLQTLGCNKDTVVGIMSENRLEYPIVIFGTILTGAPITCYNPAFTLDELKQFFDVASPAVLFCSPKNCEKVKQVAPKKCKIFEFNSEGTLDLLPKGKSPKPWNKVNNSPDDIACILYSLGTTSLAKGVALTHRNLVFVLKLEEKNLLIEHNGKMVVALTSMYRIAGFESVLAAIVKKETVIIISNPSRALYLQAVQDYKVKHFTIAPAMIPFLLKSETMEQYDLSEVEFFTLGAAPMKPGTEKALKDKFKKLKYVQQLYGMTESTMFTTIKHPDSEKAGTSGKPIPGIQIKVLHTQSGEILEKDQRGEIYIKGPTIMKEYFRNEEATAKAIDKDGWLRTGDIGYYDDDGDFFIIDRARDFIKCNNLEIAPSEIEAILLSHSSIDDAAVIGIANDEACELPRAYVVKLVDKNVTEKEITKFVAGKVPIPEMKLGGGVEFIEEIPKNAAGKILRKKLRELWDLKKQSTS